LPTIEENKGNNNITELRTILQSGQNGRQLIFFLIFFLFKDSKCSKNYFALHCTAVVITLIFFNCGQRNMQQIYSALPIGNIVFFRFLCLLKRSNKRQTKPSEKRYEHLILIDIDLSTKHNVDQLLWKAVFYQVIEVFRKHMSEEDDAKFRLTQILDEVYIYF
jgi:hypothetical protein